jgi:hypothetical protein
LKAFKKKLRILMVEDEAGDARLAERALRDAGFQFTFNVPGFAGCLAIHPAALAIPTPIYFQNTL